MPSKGAVDPVALFVKFCHNAQEVHSDTDEGEALVLFNRLAAAAVARKPQVDHLLRLLWRSRTKEMMQPCLFCLNFHLFGCAGAAEAPTAPKSTAIWRVIPCCWTRRETL